MGRCCTQEGCILEELSVELEVVPCLEDLHLIDGDVLLLSIETGDSLVDAVLMCEERTDSVYLLDLCSAEIVEVKAVVQGS